MLEMETIWIKTNSVNQMPVVGEKANWHIGKKVIVATITAVDPWPAYPLYGGLDYITDEPYLGKTEWQMKYALPKKDVK